MERLEAPRPRADRFGAIRPTDCARSGEAAKRAGDNRSRPHRLGAIQNAQHVGYAARAAKRVGTDRVARHNARGCRVAAAYARAARVGRFELKNRLIPYRVTRKSS